MTSREINRDILLRFLLRAIGHASAVAIDHAEFGLRVLNVERSDEIGDLRIDLADGHAVYIGFTHSLPGQPAPIGAPSEGARI